MKVVLFYLVICDKLLVGVNIMIGGKLGVEHKINCFLAFSLAFDLTYLGVWLLKMIGFF